MLQEKGLFQYYQHINNMFDPLEEYILEERIREMEAFLNTLIDEETL